MFESLRRPQESALALILTRDYSCQDWAGEEDDKREACQTGPTSAQLHDCWIWNFQTANYSAWRLFAKKMAPEEICALKFPFQQMNQLTVFFLTTIMSLREDIKILCQICVNYENYKSFRCLFLTKKTI